MGTIRSANKSVLRLFNGSWNDKVLDQPMDPITRQSDFRVKRLFKREDKASPKLPLALPNSFTLQHVIHVLVG